MRFWGALSTLGAAALAIFVFLYLAEQPNEFPVGEEPLKRLTGDERTWERAPETPAGPEEPLSTPLMEATVVVPCEGCLDEQAAAHVASEYLHNVGVDYIELWVEVILDFPWRGDTELVWAYDWDQADPPQEMPLFGRHAAPPPLGPWPIKYVGERLNGMPVPPSVGRPDLTWRVWYQTGWIRVETIERHVDGGLLPLEALAWPPQRYAESFLVHARTGAIAATPIDGLIGAGKVLVERDRNAKQTAARVATRWIANARKRSES